MNSACNSETDESDQDANINYHGSMHKIMQNDLSAQVDLSTLKDKEHLYALGALEGLKGEILILDGHPTISKGSDSGLVVEHSFNYKATLLVQAIVEKWSSFPVPDSISTLSQFEDFLPQLANEHDIDTSKAFPFLLEGIAASFRFHVINWKQGDTDHSYEKHKKAGPHGLINGQEVEILGFFSTKHGGKFTHHNSNLHMHVKTPYRNISGHLDNLTIGKEMVLKLPKMQ